MTIVNKLMCGAAMFAMVAVCGTVSAQDCQTGNCGTAVAGSCGTGNGDCGPCPSSPCPEVGPSNDCIGTVGPLGKRYLNPLHTMHLASQDHFSPQPLYTYGPAGLDATRMDYWNRNYGAPQNSWHGNYSYWRWGQPTALVVPPTAAFQTEYNWGVGQTRSVPIYHQFTGGAGAGHGVGAAQGGGYHGHPYWPQSTSQFGIYPVRGPW